MNLVNKIFRSFTHVVDTDHSHERGEHDSDVADHLQGQGDHLLRLHLVLHHHLHVRVTETIKRCWNIPTDQTNLTSIYQDQSETGNCGLNMISHQSILLFEKS